MSSIEVHVLQATGPFNTFQATTFEISEGGLSSATTSKLPVGTTVELNPVMGMKLRAIIRRQQKTMYGFEFVGLTPEQRNTIQRSCEKLPPFTTLNENV